MEEGSTHRRLFLQLIAGISVVIGVGLLLPIFGTVAEKGPATKSISNGKQLATACRMYAVDHDGRLPADLSELSPDYIQNLDEFRAVILMRDSKHSRLRTDWLYFGAGFTEENPPPLLLASPQTVAGKNRNDRRRVFVAGDVSGTFDLESIYQTALAKTIKARFEQRADSTAFSK